MKKKILLCGAALSALTGTANAQVAEDRKFEDEIVVTATRSERPVGALSQSVTVLNEEFLEQAFSISNDFSKVLFSNVPGVNVTTESQSDQGFQIRGRQGLLLIDGVPQQQSLLSAQDFQLGNISPDQISRIEVIRGSNAVYGFGGVGGIVNIITKGPGEGPLRFDATVGIESSLVEFSGSGIAQDASLFGSGSIGKVQYRVGGGFRFTNDDFDADGDVVPDRPFSQGRDTNENSYNFLTDLRYNIDDTQRIDLDFTYVEKAKQEYRLPTGGAFPVGGEGGQKPTGVIFTRGDAGWGDGSHTFTDFATFPGTEEDIICDADGDGNLDDCAVDGVRDRQQQALNVSLAYGNDDIFGSSLSILGFVSDTERYLPATTAASNVFTEVENRGVRIDIESPLDFILSDASVLWGFDYNNQLFTQAFVNPLISFSPFDSTSLNSPIVDIDQKSYAGFAQFEFPVNDTLTLRAGVRHEAATLSQDTISRQLCASLVRPCPASSLFTRVVTGGEVDFNETVFNAGAVVDVTDQVQFFLNFSQGFNVQELGRVIRSLSGGINPFGPSVQTTSLEELDAKAQVVDNYEIGIRYSGDRLKATLSAFFNESDLGSRLTTVNLLTGETDSVQRPEEYWGVEATLDAILTNTVTAGGNFTWQRGQVDANNTGDFIDFAADVVSPPKLTAYIEYEPTSWFRGRFSATNIFDYDEAEVNDTAVDGFFVADLFGTFDLEEAGQFDIGIENLFNELYFPVDSQAGAFNRFSSSGYIPAQGATVRVVWRKSFGGK